MKSLQEWHHDSLKIEQALRAMHLLAADAGLYTDNHPKFQATLAEVLETWEGLLSDVGEVELKRVGRDLVYRNVALQDHMNTTREFTLSMEERGIESLIVQPGLTTEELVEYAHYMRLSGSRRAQVGQAGKFLRERGVRHIQAWKLGSLQDAKKLDAEMVHALPVALKDMRAFRRDIVRAVKGLNKEAKVARVLNLNVAASIVDKFLEESAANSGLMLGLSSIRSADEYTATHSLNTCILAICICRYIGVDESVMPNVGIACLLHDIGKMFVPDAILNKPSRLTPEEWIIMEHHTTMGARFLLSIPGLSPLAPVVAYEHHMNFDRSGYPRPRRPHKINVISFVASLADFYDALSTARPYKRAMPPAEVVALIESMDDAKMEPRLRRLFLEMLGRYPVGTVVRLDTGELAVVGMKNEEDPLRPEVLVASEPDGRPLDEAVSVRLTETGGEGAFLRTIAEAVDPLEVEIDPLAILQKVLRSQVPGISLPAEPPNAPDTVQAPSAPGP